MRTRELVISAAICLLAAGSVEGCNGGSGPPEGGGGTGGVGGQGGTGGVGTGGIGGAGGVGGGGDTGGAGGVANFCSTADCDDDNECTVDTCAELIQACEHEQLPRDTSCDAGAGTCQGGACKPWLREAYIKSSNRGLDDKVGQSVAIDGDTLVAGAPGEFSAATGIDGDQGDNSARNAGAVYIFDRVGAEWTQTAYVKASNTRWLDEFGGSVSLHGDVLVVGASGEDSSIPGNPGHEELGLADGSGAAYIFERVDQRWEQSAYLKAPNSDPGDYFGGAVAAYGNAVAVSATGEDSAASGVDGNQQDNSEPTSGAVHLFEKVGAAWVPTAYFKASNPGFNDFFGSRMALTDGLLVVGAVQEDGSATGVNGTPDDSTLGAGAAYVFERVDGAWEQTAYLKASNTHAWSSFGAAVAATPDVIVVGAQYEDGSGTGVNGAQGEFDSGDSGAAYIFERAEGGWAQTAYLKATNAEPGDRFGTSVAVDRDFVVVGALSEDSAATGVDGEQDDNDLTDAGAAYVYQRIDNDWKQVAYLKAFDAREADRFGETAAISGDTFVIGAPLDDGGATNSGAAYVFRRLGSEAP